MFSDQAKRDEKLLIDYRLHYLIMINLKPLDSDRRILAEETIDETGVVAPFS